MWWRGAAWCPRATPPVSHALPPCLARPAPPAGLLASCARAAAAFGVCCCAPPCPLPFFCLHPAPPPRRTIQQPSHADPLPAPAPAGIDTFECAATFTRKGKKFGPAPQLAIPEDLQDFDPMEEEEEKAAAVAPRADKGGRGGGGSGMELAGRQGGSSGAHRQPASASDRGLFRIAHRLLPLLPPPPLYPRAAGKGKVGEEAEPAAAAEQGKAVAGAGAFPGDDGIALATMDIFAGCGGLSEGMHQAGEQGRGLRQAGWRGKARSAGAGQYAPHPHAAQRHHALLTASPASLAPHPRRRAAPACPPFLLLILSLPPSSAGAAVSKWGIEYERPAAAAFEVNNPQAAVFCNNCNVLLHAAMTKAGLEDDCDACGEAGAGMGVGVGRGCLFRRGQGWLLGRLLGWLGVAAGLAWSWLLAARGLQGWQGCALLAWPTRCGVPTHCGSASGAHTPCLHLPLPPPVLPGLQTTPRKALPTCPRSRWRRCRCRARWTSSAVSWRQAGASLPHIA